jgi:hypothetical protein
MEGVLKPAHNCILHFNINALNIYCIFPYTRQTLLLASLKPTRNLFLNLKQWNISNPYIMYVRCTWIEVQSLQTSSYTGNIPPNLRNAKQYVRKLNSRYYELARTQYVRFNHKQPRQANYSICNLVIHPSHLFHESKKDLRFPLNNIWLKLGSLRTYRTITKATKLTTTNHHQA